MNLANLFLQVLNQPLLALHAQNVGFHNHDLLKGSNFILSVSSER